MNQFQVLQSLKFFVKNAYFSSLKISEKKWTALSCDRLGPQRDRERRGQERVRGAAMGVGPGRRREREIRTVAVDDENEKSERLLEMARMRKRKGPRFGAGPCAVDGENERERRG